MSPPEHHPYGRARGQYGELFLPDGDGAIPVAVVLHGGFWKAQYGRRQTRAVCADLAARGWAAWNVEYRRLGRLSGGGYPETLEDVATAVDHLADLPAHEGGLTPLRFDLQRVAVSAVVAQAGVLDLRLASELALSDGVVHRFLGGPPETVPERYAVASPAERLPLGVPVLLTHGGRDDIVPPVMSERFAAAARAAGDDVDLVVEPGEDHFGHIEPANPLWAAVTAWLATR